MEEDKYIAGKVYSRFLGIDKRTRKTFRRISRGKSGPSANVSLLVRMGWVCRDGTLLYVTEKGKAEGAVFLS